MWSCDQYLAELLLCSGPAHQRTLNLNRWQQSQAHPAEFICYFCLRVRLAVCLVQLQPGHSQPSLPNDSPGELSTELREARVEYLKKSALKWGFWQCCNIQKEWRYSKSIIWHKKRCICKKVSVKAKQQRRRTVQYDGGTVGWHIRKAHLPEGGVSLFCQWQL